MSTTTDAAVLPRQLGWEVEAPDGTVLYLGFDLTLADEIYNGLPGGAHLHRANPSAAPKAM